MRKPDFLDFAGGTVGVSILIIGVLGFVNYDNYNRSVSYSNELLAQATEIAAQATETKIAAQGTIMAAEATQTKSVAELDSIGNAMDRATTPTPTRIHTGVSSIAPTTSPKGTLVLLPLNPTTKPCCSLPLLFEIPNQ